ncbi:MAG: sugar transferase [Bacillota bacterium]
MLMKRGLDFVLSAVGLIIAAPILMVTALAVRLSSPGPIIFTQTRVGKDGRPFKVYKFRTMRAEGDGAQTTRRWHDLDKDAFNQLKFHAGGSDPRITRVGQVLRRTSLDELPQLVNVLLGDMSLVGPRPEIPELVQLYDDYARQRLRVLPGITGLAQVSGRSELSMAEKIALDVEYVKRQTIWLDLKILALTVSVVLGGKGAR